MRTKFVHITLPIEFDNKTYLFIYLLIIGKTGLVKNTVPNKKKTRTQVVREMYNR